MLCSGCANSKRVRLRGTSVINPADDGLRRYVSFWDTRGELKDHVMVE